MTKTTVPQMRCVLCHDVKAGGFLKLKICQDYKHSICRHSYLDNQALLGMIDSAHVILNEYGQILLRQLPDAEKIVLQLGNKENLSDHMGVSIHLQSYISFAHHWHSCIIS